MTVRGQNRSRTRQSPGRSVCGPGRWRRFGGWRRRDGQVWRITRAADGSGTVRGELELAGERRPIGFDLAIRDGRLTGTAIVRQSDWGMKPYSALFGTLKVADEVEVALASRAIAATPARS